MKTLLLVRHAKSSHDDRRTSDHDRPLNARGEREAPLLGQFLRERQLRPDCVLSSTARRAQETARHLIESSGWPIELDLHRELYLAAPDNFVRVLRTLDDNLRCVAVVAHNPGLEYYVAQLTHQYVTMATSTLSEIQLDLDAWTELVPETRGRLACVWRPQDDE